jgi:Uma2 family endonuclease
MPSLLAYLIVSETEQRVERHWREQPESQWQSTMISDGTVPLPCPGVELTVEEIYRHLPPAEDE